MPETCPVCGDAIEHRRVERPGSQADDGAGASFDIEDLCTVDAETRWDRICAAATADQETVDAPELRIYYHFFGE